MSLWCIAFFVLLLLTLMLVYFVGTAAKLELAVLKKFDTIGILVVIMNGVTYTSINAPVNSLISSDQTSIMTLTSMGKATSVVGKNGNTTLTIPMNGYVIPVAASMNILSGINPPTTPLKTTIVYPTATAITGFSFTALSVVTSKPLNIDSSKFPSADSSLTAYTLTKKDIAYVL